jgi:EAL and modified HD-GYP domain-containing signal transduction protein
MCEELAQRSSRPPKESYFLAGMLSVMDALLDQPMAEIPQALPLDEDIKNALLTRQGPLASRWSAPWPTSGGLRQ